MVARVIRSDVLIVLTSLILTGCGPQAAKGPSRDPALSATGPGFGYTAIPRTFITPSIEAAGGLPAWTRCRRLAFDAVVTALNPDGGVYLTEHQFTLYPWSDTIEVTAGEPRTRLTWRVDCGRYSCEGDEEADISPLKGCYREYAEAVLQIVTAPARMLENSVELTRKPVPVQLTGQWYQPIDARFMPQEPAFEGKGRKQASIEPYWTQGTYFQNHGRAVVDLIWLGNPLAQKFVLVRGYDYVEVADGVRIPTKIEVFRSGPDAQFGPRLASLDLKQ